MASSDDPNRSGARARLLAAARALFAEGGYDRTTLRAVAGAAEADPALVIRYFGSKEGLFAAVAEIELPFPDFGAIPPGEHGIGIARQAIAVWDGPEGRVLQPILRACATHEAAAERARAVFGTQARAMVAGLGVDEPGRRAGLIASQMLGFMFCRYVLRLPDIAAMDASTVATSLGPTLQRYLYADLDPE